jgi:hypothetical protein
MFTWVKFGSDEALRAFGLFKEAAPPARFISPFVALSQSALTKARAPLANLGATGVGSLGAAKRLGRGVMGNEASQFATGALKAQKAQSLQQMMEQVVAKPMFKPRAPMAVTPAMQRSFSSSTGQGLMSSASPQSQQAYQAALANLRAKGLIS